MPLKLFLCCCLFPWIVESAVTRFEFRDAVQRNVVFFISDALLEKTVGLSNAIAGWIEVDPDRVGAGLNGEFEVDMRTFDTGIELKNEHLREKFLSTSEVPFSMFTLKRVASSAPPKLTDQQPVTLMVEGELKLKGVSKLVTLPLKLTFFRESEITKQRSGGNLLKLAANFEVDLPTFNIPWPENWRSRLARKIQVSVDALGTTAPPPVLIPTIDPSKAKETKKP